MVVIMDKEIAELLKKFLMLSALAKDDSPSDPLPSFSSQVPIENKQSEVKATISDSRFPALRAKLAKAEVQPEESQVAE